MAEEFKTRLASANDRAFIFATWLKSYRFGGSVEEIPQDLYFEGQHRVIEALIDRCVVIVAHAPDDPDTLLGWAVFERRKAGLAIHYVYVKGAFRKLGIAKAMLESLALNDLQYSHRTGALEWIKLKLPTARFNPFAILEDATNGAAASGHEAR